MPRFPLLFVAALFALLCSQHLAIAQAIQYGEYRYSWREDPGVNQYLSARYDYLLQTNPRFRSYRMWKECHVLNWPGLHGECLASFDQFEPYRGY